MRFSLRNLTKIMKQRESPVWRQPNNDTRLQPKLKLHNSLTNQKDLFIPKVGNKVEWYSCGPTVYDVSHMGHARTYISIDILRRVMESYFKYDIHFVMNITDIDDKIIKRARQTYLFEKYLKEENQNIKSDLASTLKNHESKLTKETDEDKKKMYSDEIKKIQSLLTKSDINKLNLIDVKDSFSDYLDSKEGSSIRDNSIFEALPKKFEQEFLDDMKRLNILPPTELTRVSEYVENIVCYVEEIVNKGLAYVSNGSVYFDTNKFDNEKNFYYAKLVPNAYGNESLLREGEGVLSNVNLGDNEKKSDTDFVLWKASKPGEPSWTSPWGMGRPGWHIECSAMASDKCGETLDIHTGGVDLKFPHHDNELAQAEAYHNCDQWVNYFLHTGHLTIQGCKMSKSLKNFISIRQALDKNSWRQLRFAFLLSSWKDTLDYSDETMVAACSFEKLILDFFFTVRHVIRINARGKQAGDSIADTDLPQQLQSAKQRIDVALCDSIDTRECLNTLRDLIQLSIGHYTTKGATGANMKDLREIALFVYELLAIFGAAESNEEFGLIKYTDEEIVQLRKSIRQVGSDFVYDIEIMLNCEEVGDTEESILNLKKLLGEYRACSDGDINEIMEKIADLRQNIRVIAIEKKLKKLLPICDQLRDNKLVMIGVRLQDNEDGIASIGLMPTWAIEKKVEKSKEKINGNKKEKMSKTDPSTEPIEMFKVGQYLNAFSEFDDKGIPTHDCDGKELAKSRRKTLAKEQQVQEKAFKKYKQQL